MSEKIDMLDFFLGDCVAVRDQKKFVHNWVETNRNPCSACGIKKSKCSFNKILERRRVE